MILRVFGSLFVGIIINSIFFYKEPLGTTTNVGMFDLITIEMFVSLIMGFVLVQLTIELYVKLKDRLKQKG